MTTANLAHDVTYIETMAKALANTSAHLVDDVADLRALIEKLPAIVTDVRIGQGEYHACPRDLAPMAKLIEIVKGGGLVLVEDSKRALYRLVEYNVEQDEASITPIRNEVGRTTVTQAGRWVYGFVIYLKLNA